MKKTTEFFEMYGSSKTDKTESVVFTPHMSNVIPDSIAAVQEEISTPKKSGFDDSVKAYFDRNTTTISEKTTAAESLIPDQAVVPKETIAPPKKKNNNKALAELMSIIDAEETKLKR